MRELCQVHKLVVAPDGKCVVCRRPPKPLFTVREEHETLISRIFTGLLGLGLLAGAGMLVYALRLGDGYTGARIVGSRSGLEPLPEQAEPQAGTTPSNGASPQQQNAVQTASAANTKQPEQAAANGRSEQAVPARMPTAALQQVEVVMYATPWCDICDRARSFLRARDVVLIERDIEGDKEAAQKLAKINAALSVPTFEIGGNTYVGFSPWDLEDALHATAQQRVTASAEAPRPR